MTMRHPRPKGTTMLLQRKNYDNKDKELIKLLLLDYINNSFTIQLQPTSIDQLCIYYDIDEHTTKEVFNDLTKNYSGLLGGDTMEGTIRALLFSALNNTLGSRALIQQQVHKLIDSQGDGYKAFVTSEVNKSLKLLLDSDKNMMDWAKTLQSSSPQTVNLITHTQQDTQQQAESLDTNKALLLMEQAGHTALLAKDDKALEDQYKGYLDDTPEVDARLIGHGEKEGLSIGNAAAAQLENAKALQREDHTNRRAELEGLDVNESLPPQ